MLSKQSPFINLHPSTHLHSSDFDCIRFHYHTNNNNNSTNMLQYNWVSSIGCFCFTIIWCSVYPLVEWLDFFFSSPIQQIKWIDVNSLPKRNGFQSIFWIHIHQWVSISCDAFGLINLIAPENKNKSHFEKKMNVHRHKKNTIHGTHTLRIQVD